MAMADVVEQVQDNLPLIGIATGVLAVIIGGVFFYTKARYGVGQFPPFQAIAVGVIGMFVLGYLTRPKQKTRRW